MNEILDSELNSAFASPDREFCGDRLAPYTEGSRLLLMQAKSDEDSSIFFVWAFIYLHIHLAKNRKETIKLAWNKENFREKVLDWADTKTPADRDKATNIVGEILDESSRGTVEAVKTGIPLGND